MLNIAALALAYRTRQATPSATLQSLLDQIAASPLNSFISIDADAVRREAAAADQAYADPGAAPGVLCGIPIAIKDLIDVAGMRTTMGSEQYAHNLAARDAVVVQRLREQGAIVIGKANTHEFAYGPTGDRSFFGAARNPHNPAHMTGGSSSGSAASLGGGLCAGALGTDTSASIRLPAALCGVVGMKPTYDLLPRAGAFELSRTLDHVGPLSSTVRDNALLLDVLAGVRQESYARLIGQPIRGLTIGMATGFYGDYLDAPVRQALERARTVFEQAGARVVPVEIPRVQDIYDAQQLVLKAEAYASHQQALDAG
ncbi:MAG TPA: amidase, partial [Bordetella sp.]|nr:amidase [Bordetella sp.]